MNFRAFAIRATLSVGLGGCVGLVLATKGLGAYALVAQQLTTSAVGLCLFWILSGWRPRRRFSRRAARDLLGFSTATLVGRLGIFVNRRSDALLMGLFFGPTAVGLYRLADRVVGVCVDFAAVSVQSVALPEFSRFQDAPERLRESFVRCLRISACLALPPLGVLAAGAPEVVSVLGERWRDAAPALAALCVVGAVRDLGLFTGPLLQALGRPHVLAALVWAQAVPSALVFAAMGSWLSDAQPEVQALGIAASRAALFFLLFLVNMRIARGLIEIRLRTIAVALSPAFFSAGVGAAAVFAMRTLVEGLLPQMLQSLIILGIAGSLALASLLTLDAEARELVARPFRRASSRRADVP